MTERKPIVGRWSCCGTCRMTGLVPTVSGGMVCFSCRVPWDGSEVDRNKLPEILERQIADGACTREQAYASFLKLDELASAAATDEITYEQGLLLVEQEALVTRGKARPQ